MLINFIIGVIWALTAFVGVLFVAPLDKAVFSGLLALTNAMGMWLICQIHLSKVVNRLKCNKNCRPKDY